MAWLVLAIACLCGALLLWARRIVRERRARTDELDRVIERRVLEAVTEARDDAAARRVTADSKTVQLRDGAPPSAPDSSGHGFRYVLFAVAATIIVGGGTFLAVQYLVLTE